MRTLLSIILALLLLLTTVNLTKNDTKIKCSQVARKTQKYGEYTPLSGGMGVSVFESLQKGTLAKEANKVIPPRCMEATRVALYNAGLSRISNKPTVEKIMTDVTNMDATVIVFQDAKNMPALETHLKASGYDFILKEGSIIMASLLPIRKVSIANVKVQHLRARVTLDDFDLDILSIWMIDGESEGKIPSEAVFGKVYLSQAPRNSSSPTNPDILQNSKNQLTVLGSSVFSLLNKPEPPFTANNGLVMDSIGGSTLLARHLCGAYVYHTDSTGRLPILVDLGNCQMRTPLWIYLSFGTLLVAVVFGYFFFRRYRRPTPPA